MGKNLYSALGVGQKASKSEIKAAYRDKAKELHPDMEKGDTQKFKDVAQAYAVLINPVHRERYDKGEDPEAILRKSENSIESSAIGLFHEVISKISPDDLPFVDVFHEIRTYLDQTQQKLVQAYEEGSRELEKWKKLAGRSHARKGESIFEGVIADKIKDIELGIENLKKKHEQGKKIKAFLVDYAWKKDQKPLQQQAFDQFGRRYF